MSLEIQKKLFKTLDKHRATNNTKGIKRIKDRIFNELLYKMCDAYAVIFIRNHPSIELDDAKQTAYVEAVYAIEMFDTKQEVKIATYAHHKIKEALKQMQYKDATIKPRVTARRNTPKVLQQITDMYKDQKTNDNFYSNINLHHVAEGCNLSYQDVDETLALVHNQQMIRLDTSLEGSDNSSFGGGAASYHEVLSRTEDEPVIIDKITLLNTRNMLDKFSHKEKYLMELAMQTTCSLEEVSRISNNSYEFTRKSLKNGFSKLFSSKNTTFDRYIN